MITLKVNNEYLELDKNFKVDLVIDSPLFSFTAIPGTFTYSLSVNATPHNRRVLNNPDEWSNKEALAASFDCELNLHDYKITGKLKFPTEYAISNKSYSIIVKSAILDLKDYLNDTYLDSLTYDANENIPNGTRLTQELTIGLSAGAGVLDVYLNPYGTVNTAWNTDLQTTLQNLADNITLLSASCFCTAAYMGNYLAPGIYYITITATFTGHNPDLFCKYQSDSATTWVIPYANTSRALQIYDDDLAEYADTFLNEIYPDIKFAWPVMKNLHTGGTPEVYNNFNDGGTYALQYIGSAGVPSVPCPYLFYVLKFIFSDNAYQAQGDLFDNWELMQLIIYNPYMLYFATNWKTTDGGSNGTYAGVSIEDHVPHITLAEFLNAIKNYFGWSYFFDANKKIVKIKSYKDILADTSYIDWSKKLLINHKKKFNLYTGFLLSFTLDSTDVLLDAIEALKDYFNDRGEVADSSARLALADPEVNDYCLQLDENTYYVYEYNGGSPQWAVWTYNLLNYEHEDGSQSINPALSTLVMDIVTEMGRDWLIPKADQDNIDASENTDPDYGFRLLFMRGLYIDENDQIYPFASNDIYDYDGNQVGNYSLRWQSENGLFNVWWKNWLNFLLNTVAYKVNMNLNIQDLISLDLSKKVYILNSIFLIKQIKITFDYKGVKPAKVELYKVNQYDVSDFSEDCIEFEFDYSTLDSEVDDEDVIAWLPTFSGCCGGVDSYELANGALPDGLSLNAGTGEISGTVNTPGTFRFVIKVTDDCGNIRYKVYQVVVNAP